jgi:hypothetical protein
MVYRKSLQKYKLEFLIQFKVVFSRCGRACDDGGTWENPHPRDLLSGFWEHIDLGGGICSHRTTCKQAEAPLVNRRPWRRVPELIPNNRDNTNQWPFIIMFESVEKVQKPTVYGHSVGNSSTPTLFFS